ncbi:MAG: outer membrane lipoprotein carrier protein LolA, partial [Parasphingorhabdus sp.]
KKPGAPAGLSLDGWVSLDSKNNRTSIRLSNQKFGVPVANSSFNWTDPRRKSRGKR